MGTLKRNGVLGYLILSAALLLAGPRMAAAEQRIALIIGNSAYPSAPLRNPLNDARALTKSLNQLGFEVLLKTNLNQKGMVDAIREFSARLKEGDVALFYYSGHGMQVKGRNFLIPVDADIRAEDEVPYLSFDVSQVLDKLEFARTRVNLVILDACRNNPFIRTFRSSRVGLAQMDAPGGTLIAFSTAPGAEARDGDTDLGTYTKYLVSHVSTPNLPVEVMFRRVREGVTAETKDRQVPWESSSLKGDFYFSRAVEKPILATPAPAPVNPQQVDPMTVELAFWDSIRASSNPADFEVYLQQYPGGKFAPLARNRLQALQQSAIPPANQQATANARATETGKERAALTKLMEDERTQRAREAEAAKLEMEKLRSELLTLRGTPPTAATPAAAPKSENTSVPAYKPVELALASPSAPAAGPAPFATEWAQRIALLEQTKALTFAKGLAVLLNIENAEDLSILLAFGERTKAKAWNNAFAMGADSTGSIVWGGGYRLRNPDFATQTALEFCAKANGNSCRVVMVNGEFRETSVLEMAKTLGAKSVAATRAEYLRSLRKDSAEITVGGGGTHFNYLEQAKGYHSLHE